MSDVVKEARELVDAIDYMDAIHYTRCPVATQAEAADRFVAALKALRDKLGTEISERSPQNYADMGEAPMLSEIDL